MRIRITAVVAITFATVACQDNGSQSSVKVTCNPPSILSGDSSRVFVVVTQNNQRAMGREVTFSASNCGGTLNPDHVNTSSGVPGTTTLNEGEAESSYIGDTLKTCTATIMAKAIGLSDTCQVTVSPKPISVPAVDINAAPGTQVPPDAPMVVITPNVIQDKNPLKMMYAITTNPGTPIVSINVTVQKKSDIDNRRAATKSPANPPKGVLMAGFVETTQLDDDDITVSTDGGLPGGTTTLDVVLKDGSNMLTASFKGSSALPGPKP